MGIVRMNLGTDSYDIVVRRGVLSEVGAELDLDRKVLVVSDDGVPDQYADEVMAQAREGFRFVFPAGEESKSLFTFEDILKHMLRCGFSRKDCVVAVGGGVSGDMAGFAAACYMRGIDFYNIPTTVLSQVDSSIGGKTAVNLDSVKNIVGAFYQPKKVLIDPEVLGTLSRRQISNGLAEAFKMACTFDEKLFRFFIEDDAFKGIDSVIERSLELKRDVVEKDEKEGGLRKVLNFGHTIGHGIESTLLEGTLHHGECVALGMLPMCSPEVRKQLETGLNKLGIPTSFNFNEDAVLEAIAHDKKSSGDRISTVYVPEVGKFEFRDLSISEIRELLSVIKA